MTSLILVLIAFGVLNIIHHLTVIEQLKAVKRNQIDLIDYLDSIDDDMVVIYDDLKEIKRLIQNISLFNQTTFLNQ